MNRKCLQEIYAPENACFGCGPANKQGLQLRSFEDGDMFVAKWQPQTHHEAYPDVLAGGIIGTLLDCHSTWSAAIHMMRIRQQPFPPCTVTSSYAVKLLWPVPTSIPVHIFARVIESSIDRCTVEATLTSDTRVCASCRGLFIAVKPGHPAYHRW
ncbi:MAG: PaaI family thioesterase [Deltaproteobacteria bacterium]|nr:PaaI family thioesterase [Deltaproteobacteria bacterium]